jgi:hypothetical protein
MQYLTVRICGWYCEISIAPHLFYVLAASFAVN